MSDKPATRVAKRSTKPVPRAAQGAKAKTGKSRNAVAQPTSSPRIVCVTGAFGFLGRRVVRALEADPTIDRIVAIDMRDPLSLATRDLSSTSVARDAADPAHFLAAHPRLSSHQLDLTASGADRQLADILASEQVGTLVHLAYLSTPTHALEMAHELETIGTLHVLNAAASSGITSLVSLSSTLCYGARRDNPAWITEDQPLRPPQARSLVDKADADQQVQRFAAEHPAVRVAIARMGATVCAGRDHLWTRIFRRRFVPAIAGYDPLFQLLHGEDAVVALHRLIQTDARGAFNVVGRGVLPLSVLRHRINALPFYVTPDLGHSILAALWSAQLIELPPAYLEFFQWSFVCDGAKLQSATGFVPMHDLSTLAGVLRAERDGTSSAGSSL